MAHTDHVAEAIRYLEASRRELEEELTKVLQALELLQAAPSAHAVVLPTATPARPSVKSQVQKLLEEQGGPWKAPAIADTIKGWEDTPEVTDLPNAVRTALLDLTKSGLVVRVGYGSYRGAKWESHDTVGTIPLMELVNDDTHGRATG
ncbi:MAG TPA: hypothetical protein VHB02_00130 [Acidimicrobiales bacterium]|nr:hypothetical protein [Acidimicrobiales bacterium]